MSPLIYAINIGTLAIWLSVAGFGTVGIVVPTAREEFGQEEPSRDPYHTLDATLLTEGFTSGDLPPSPQTDTGTTGESAEMDQPVAEEEAPSSPPAMPEVAEMDPLPEIPDLSPRIAPPPASIPTPASSSGIRPRSAPRPSSASRSPGGSPQGKPTATGKAGNGGRGGGSGTSDAKRLAGGRMPPPAYPSEARAKGQSGTVIVEFIVGENGGVISAYAKNPSPWPILNERAVSCVRRWKFPPGNVTKYVRPIIFKLN